MKSICIVGKGGSLLSQDLADDIDFHDIVIRVNHLPNETNCNIIGRNTTILSTRSKYKLAAHITDIKEADIWICSSMLDEHEKINAKFIDTDEWPEIRKYFNNCMNLKLNKNDSRVNLVMPDTGITTILLALIRFPLHKISVCGFDMYDGGNHSIYESKQNYSIFLTPVFQQMIYYKSLIRSGIITQL
jgi:hypothetical protein